MRVLSSSWLRRANSTASKFLTRERSPSTWKPTSQVKRLASWLYCITHRELQLLPRRLTRLAGSWTEQPSIILLKTQRRRNVIDTRTFCQRWRSCRAWTTMNDQRSLMWFKNITLLLANKWLRRAMTAQSSILLYRERLLLQRTSWASLKKWGSIRQVTTSASWRCWRMPLEQRVSSLRRSWNLHRLTVTALRDCSDLWTRSSWETWSPTKTTFESVLLIC